MVLISKAKMKAISGVGHSRSELVQSWRKPLRDESRTLIRRFLDQIEPAEPPEPEPPLSVGTYADPEWDEPEPEPAYEPEMDWWHYGYEPDFVTR